MYTCQISCNRGLKLTFSYIWPHLWNKVAGKNQSWLSVGQVANKPEFSNLVNSEKYSIKFSSIGACPALDLGSLCQKLISGV